MACPGNRHSVSAHFRSLYKSQADCRIYELLTCVEWMRDGTDRQTDGQTLHLCFTLPVADAAASVINATRCIYCSIYFILFYTCDGLSAKKSGKGGYTRGYGIGRILYTTS